MQLLISSESCRSMTITPHFVLHSSGVFHTQNSGSIPYRESARDGKKNDDNDGEGGLIVRMYHHIEVYNQSLQKGKADYHQK